MCVCVGVCVYYVCVCVCVRVYYVCVCVGVGVCVCVGVCLVKQLKEALLSQNIDGFIKTAILNISQLSEVYAK